MDTEWRISYSVLDNIYFKRKIFGKHTVSIQKEWLSWQTFQVIF